MKNTLKFLIIAFLATNFIFTSCNKDDDDFKITLKGMVGSNWELNEVSYAKNKIDKNKIKAMMGISLELSFKDDNVCLIKVDKKSTSFDNSEFNEVIETSWSIDGEKIIIKAKNNPNANIEDIDLSFIDLENLTLEKEGNYLVIKKEIDSSDIPSLAMMANKEKITLKIKFKKK